MTLTLSRTAKLISLATLALVAMLSLASAQQSFKTPEEAVDTLVAKVRAGDRSGVLSILGRAAGADIASSGDDVADAQGRQVFLAAYDIGHKVVTDGDKATLVVGRLDFPFPIPLVRKNNQWQFDTAAGRLEILYRRIGRNELAAIQAALAYVDAQNEYAGKDRGAGVGVYAQRFASQAGKKDGLYWPAAQGEDESPLGPLVAGATAEGYRLGGRMAPYHGYYFRILSRQGPTAPGGAVNYVVGGKMIGGFGLLAYPAEYGNSGVMTFMVNHTGAVYQKDLGPYTARRVRGINSFNPDQTWKRVPVVDLTP